MLRRYRRSLLLAPVVGAAGGIIVGLGLYLGGNPDYRDGGLGAFFSLVVPGALLAVATAVLAVVGGAVGLLLHDRRLESPRGRRVAVIVLGATIAAGVGWFALPPAIHDLTVVIGIIPVGALVYGALLWVLRIEGRDELDLLLGRLRGKVSPK